MELENRPGRERCPNNISSSNDGLKYGPDTPQMPCGHSMGGRNLIVCIDGTSNQFGAKNTNVIELYNLILKEVEDNQRTWYNSGIGTYARPSWKSLNFYKQVLCHKIDLAIAWGFERTILGAYRWLSDNYEKGDIIFLFGFSRGAYQVRILSAMIDKVGLIHKGNEMQIPFAYELYADLKSDEPKVTQVGQLDSSGEMSMAKRFKRAFSHKDVKVHFVGAWDTVSSIGVVRGKKLLPGTIDGMKHVCYFRHALALDERRVKFLPEYAYGGTSIAREENDGMNVTTIGYKSLTTDIIRGEEDKLLQTKDDAPGQSQAAIKLTEKRPQTMEVWFAGTHSDIGGGNTENVGMDRRKPPLRWMVFEAGLAGLRTAPLEHGFLSEDKIEIKESLTWHWWFLEVLPFKRLTFTRREDGKLFTHKPHLGSNRKIHPGQKIHSSLLLDDGASNSYTPKARPVNDDFLFWTKLDTEKFRSEWLETDLYEVTQTAMKDYIAGYYETSLRILQKIATSGDGRQAIYEKMVDVLGTTYVSDGVHHRLLKFSTQIFRKDSRDKAQLKLMPSVEVRPSLSKLLQSNNKEYQKTAREFLMCFADPCIHVLRGHRERIWPVAFSRNGKRIASGSDDGTIRIWDAETGKVVGELLGHTGVVNSVAFSPDGKLVVSSSDRTAQIWDVVTGKPTREPFRGDTAVVSVGFSSDGKHVVSGLVDGTLRKWDVDKRDSVGKPFPGHVFLVADGNHIISSPVNWDTATVEHLQGHTEYVSSFAFSPDGECVLASHDHTVQLRDVKTGKPVGEPFDEVKSAAFSSDGNYVVSGNKAVRIWDAETGTPLGEPFRGHKGDVSMVKFSPDGKLIVSCSRDMTIRIWDAQIVEMPKIKLYEATQTAMENFIRNHDTASQDLRTIATSGYGQQAIYQKILKFLAITDAEVQHRLLSFSMEIFREENARLKLRPSVEIRALVSSLLESDNKEYQKTAREFLVHFANPCIHILHGHTSKILSVAFSSDSKRIASCSADGTIRIWDAELGKVTVTVRRPLRGHESVVNSVAFSLDDKFVVSSSFDKTVRIWDVETGEPVRAFRGHTAPVVSVALSSDGKHIVSGSFDRTLRKWDMDTGDPVGEFRGHTSLVTSVALAPDDKRIVSGSEDCSVRIWNAETGKPVGKPLGHKMTVSSVAFSPDGECIVSSSFDGTIRIWNVEPRKLIGESRSIGAEAINFVAFSPVPGRKRIVSGSDDNLVRIWNIDSETDEPVELFQGHRGPVLSVKFSPDGKRIVSGSSDGTVRIWDAVRLETTSITNAVDTTNGERHD